MHHVPTRARVCVHSSHCGGGVRMLTVTECGAGMAVEQGIRDKVVMLDGAVSAFTQGLT